ncbi:MAG: reductive dehalogenase domain-containing protein [Chloroflexota bacterium]
MIKIGHEVVRPGKTYGASPVTIPVPQELETVPGIPLNLREVDWYAREYPLESMNITERASRDWANTFRDTHIEMREIRKEHEKLNRGLIVAGRLTAEMEPTAEPTGEDVTGLIKEKARQLGYLEVGITAYDHRYEYQSKRDFTKFPHAICLAYEQDFEPTQTIPSVDAEIVHSSTYRTQAAAGLELGNFIRSLGYRAHVIHSGDATGPLIPMFVAAGLGSLGACGYLLTPHAGNRNRLMMVTTDAQVTYDQPVDYGIHAFCQVCQVCVNRCPGRALMRDKIWWRGIEKNKLYFKRCRPVMARYLGCGICMKVCPIQKYGLKNVMEHYAETGQVLGKGTHDLEGYTLEGKGYFGPGEMPVFDRGFFEMPHGDAEEWTFDSFKQKAVAAGGVVSDELIAEFKREMTRALRLESADVVAMMDQDADYI